jgi:hypothetical protein
MQRHTANPWKPLKSELKSAMNDRGTVYTAELPARRRRGGLKEEPMSEANKQLVRQHFEAIFNIVT